MEKSIAKPTTNSATTAQETLNDALKLLQAGHRLKHIKEKTGVDTAKLSLVARKLRITRGVFHETREAVRLVTEENLTVREASQKTGISKSKIYYAVRSQLSEKVVRLPSADKLARWNEIVAKRAAGVSLSKIGKDYGVSRQRIHQLLAKSASYEIETASEEGTEA
jgi:predicted DNA-binding transcriptional regulator AlpA